MNEHGFLPFAAPDIGDEEIAEVVDSLRSGWLTTGPKARQFEKDFGAYLGAGVECIAVNSATAALHIALEAMGIGPGDEVITTTHTFTATAEVVRYLGADTVFVDIDPSTYCIDLPSIRRAVTSRTRAIIPVHFAGHPCDMGPILEFARGAGIKVLDDAAHAFPSHYEGRLIGTLPTDATAFSFYANKTMTTGEGGMLVTSDESIARVRQSQQMDPLNSVLNGSVAMILYLARQFDQAKDELSKALEIDPNHFLLHFRLGLVCQQQNLFREAIEEMQQAVNLSGKSTEALTGLAQAYAAAGMQAPMQEIVDTLTAESRARYVSPYGIARVYGSIGDKEKTLAWLVQACAEHHPDLIELTTEPSLDSVRSDRKFRDLLSRVGFGGVGTDSNPGKDPRA
jgi:hypothetical protein